MQEWHLENKQYEALEKQNGDCVVKDKRENKFYFQNEYYISQKYEFTSKELICWNWKDNLLLVGILLSIMSMILVFYSYTKIYNANTQYGTAEYIESLVFVFLSIMLHELFHGLIMRFYGRKPGKIKIKFYFKIFPCVVTNTSDSYLLPNYRRGFVYYAGIMVNWITCGVVLVCFSEYAYLLRAIVWLTIYNMIPFGGIRTDGYHIIVNTILGVRDLKQGKNIISEVTKYAFIVFAVISFYQSIVFMMNG